MDTNLTAVIVAGLVSLPAAWFGAVLFERIPDNLPLFKPFPGLGVSIRHPFIHLVTTGLFVVTAWRFGSAPPLVLAAYLLFFAACVSLAAIDVATLRLPDRIVVPLLIISIPLVTVASILNHDAVQIRSALAGGALYFGFLLLTHLAFPKGMGFGDVKLSAVMGMYIGWVAAGTLGAVIATLYAMIIGFVVGAAMGIVVFAFRRKSKPYPFGPFLIFGAIAVILASPQLLTSSL